MYCVQGQIGVKQVEWGPRQAEREHKELQGQRLTANEDRQGTKGSRPGGVCPLSFWQ